MIKFFRKIRQRLLSENKFSKYLIYAIGEIILVVIGILIALGINNWNQKLIGDKKELDLLKNLSEDLSLNISMIKKLGDEYALKEKECMEGMKILKNASSIQMILEADSLIDTSWEVFSVNRNTYDEMLNTGTFYTLKNKKLQEAIRTHFIEANTYVKDFQEINRNGQDIAHNNEELYIIELLEDRMNDKDFNIKGLDTTWITNQNSLQYLAFYKQGKYFTFTNKIRKEMIANFIDSCKELSEKIETELKK